MKRLKILHGADFHLGARFPALGAQGRDREREIMSSFEQSLAYCREEKIQVYLIAGDFLESSTLRSDCLKEIKEGFASIPQTKIFIIAGNHDYYAVNSPYDQAWPANVKIFRGPLEVVYLEEEDAYIFAASFTASHQRQSLFKDFAKIDPATKKHFQEAKHKGSIFIGLFHGDLVSPGQESLYNPMDLGELPYGFFDYLALGHIHKRSPIQEKNGILFAYSGCHDGRSFSDSDVKGLYAGYVSQAKVDLEFIPMASRRFLNLRLDISQISSHQDLVHAILDQINEKDRANNFYRIVLTGKKDKNSYYSLKHLEEKLEDAFYYLELEDQSSFALAFEDLVNDQGLGGELLGNLFHKKDQAEKDGDSNRVLLFDRAIQFTLDALAEES